MLAISTMPDETFTAPACQIAEELSQGWSAALQLEASSYMAAHRLTAPQMLRVDVVLMLLRINTREALQAAQELTGRAITQCPSAVPPWPPKRPEDAARGPRVIWLAPNPCSPTTAMHARYGQVAIGRTREQLLARGVTPRDLSYWGKRGHVKFTEE